MPLQTPSLKRRMACWSYEGVLLVGVLAALAVTVALAAQLFQPLRSRLATQVMLFGGLGCYFVYFWRRGRTLAMQTWKIRIVDHQGQALSIGRATLRYVLAWLWFLPPLGLAKTLQLHHAQLAVVSLIWVSAWAMLSLLGRDHQFVHDRLAGTRLIDTGRQDD